MTIEAILHQEKVKRIIGQLKSYKGAKPVSFRKKVISHEVPKPNDKRHTDNKIDIRDLNEILHIDPMKRICIAEPGVTFIDLVTATIKYGLAPIIVPELKTITIGGAVAGGSIESMSYKFGGFHDTCLEYEVITAKGEVLTCTPDNGDKLLFQMVHGSFGTLGIISKLTFKLIPSKPYVKVTYKKYKSFDDYSTAILAHYKKKDVDFMDGIIHSPTKCVLSLANFSDDAPYTNNYDWFKVYYKSTKTLKEDYLKTVDYFFRYNRGVTNVIPKSFLGRLLFGKFITSTQILYFAKLFRKVIPSDKIPVTVDLFIPYSKFILFMDWYKKELNHFPLWCVPYKLVRDYEWLSSEFISDKNDKLFLDVAIYGMKKKNNKNYYKIIEDKIRDIKGIKTLISPSYYSETDFWKIWNKKNYFEVKKKTDPDNIFRAIYNKTCKAMRGIE
ncbi:FAD-binding oxidoreductase [Thermodesulfobacteriota bacterium]